MYMTLVGSPDFSVPTVLIIYMLLSCKSKVLFETGNVRFDTISTINCTCGAIKVTMKVNFGKIN